MIISTRPAPARGWQSSAPPPAPPPAPRPAAHGPTPRQQQHLHRAMRLPRQGMELLRGAIGIRLALDRQDGQADPRDLGQQVEGGGEAGIQPGAAPAAEGDVHVAVVPGQARGAGRPLRSARRAASIAARPIGSVKKCGASSTSPAHANPGRTRHGWRRWTRHRNGRTGCRAAARSRPARAAAPAAPPAACSRAAAAGRRDRTRHSRSGNRRRRRSRSPPPVAPGNPATGRRCPSPHAAARWSAPPPAPGPTSRFPACPRASRISPGLTSPAPPAA